MITEPQYQKLMKSIRKTGGVVSHAALKAGMDRRTAVRYLKAGASPTALKQLRPKKGRTVPDPIAALWPAAVQMLTLDPTTEATALFEYLLRQHPQVATTAAKSLRTFQRRVKQWLAAEGPDREVHFPQRHPPGQVMQFDWTDAKHLKVTLAGVPFDHLLAQGVLPYSNGVFAVPCLSESALSLKAGVQAAYWEFGGVTPILQTDQSSTATHQLSRSGPQRGFNVEYLALCKHLGCEPRTIHVGSPNENGDVESQQGHLKRRLEQQLKLRGSRDFKDEADYACFVAQLCRRVNAQPIRRAKFEEERPLLRPLPKTRFPEYSQTTARVSSYALISVKRCAYSVPSRLIGQWVQVHLSETEVRIYHAQKLVAQHRRATGEQPSIDYRHVISSLHDKPGAFARLTYREQLFPTLVFRQAYAQLQAHEERLADRRYIHLLSLATTVGEAKVEEAIAECLRGAVPPTPDRVRKQMKQEAPPDPATRFAPLVPELGSYDRLLEGRA